MLSNYHNTYEAEHVKFVSYSGKYPNYCSGNLILNIDGKDVEFGFRNKFGNTEVGSLYPGNSSNSEENMKNAIPDKFWIATNSEWEVDYEMIPDEYKKYAYEIDKVFCENIHCGHCGGCN